MSEKDRLKPAGAAMSPWPWGELAYMAGCGGDPAGKESDVRATCIMSAQGWRRSWWLRGSNVGHGGRCRRAATARGGAGGMRSTGAHRGAVDLLFGSGYRLIEELQVALVAVVERLQ